MFRNAKRYDRVWSFSNRWGTIMYVGNINNKFINYPIEVRFDNGVEETYTIDGKHSINDECPVLFWSEVKYKAPEKPFNLEDELRRLEVVEFNIENRNYYLYWDNCGENIEYYNSYFDEFINYKFFSESSIKKFMDNVKDEKITKEEFFKAYNIVFGGK